MPEIKLTSFEIDRFEPNLWLTIGPICSNVGRIRPDLAKVGQTLAELRPTSVEVAQVLPISGKGSPNLVKPTKFKTMPSTR